MKINRERIIESGKLTFAILGGGGWCGYVASMHIFLALVSVASMAAVWYAVYLHTEIV